ncbi:hypothetical protein BFW90_15750 [Pseudomonas fluorescens]|nr:hypothetical protein BFW90_15750 [Pseudomonas fluorescens]
MLAKNVNDNAPHLDERGALAFFASKLAPTDGTCDKVWLLVLYKKPVSVALHAVDRKTQHPRRRRQVRRVLRQ